MSAAPPDPALGALSSRPDGDPLASSSVPNRKVSHAKIPFRAKLTFLAALLTVVPLTVVGFLVIRDATSTVEKLNREFRAQVVGNIQAMIESDLQGAQDGLDLVGRTIFQKDILTDRVTVSVPATGAYLVSTRSKVQKVMVAAP